MEEEIKVIFLGYLAVGKTNIINAFIGIPFSNEYKQTYSNCYNVKKMEIANKMYEIQLWDTNGEEKFKSITKLFLKNSKIIILVYDTTKRESFNELEYWIDVVKDFVDNEYIIGIIGNKADLFLNEQVSKAEAEQFAESKGYSLILLSVKDNPNKVKDFIRKLIIEYIETFSKTKKRESFHLYKDKNEEVKRRNNGCCGGYHIKYSFMERYKARVFPWYLPEFELEKNKEGLI